MSNPLDVLLPTPTVANESWHWCTVASIDPLLVQLDGDEAPLLTPPENLVGKMLSVGDRVWAQRYGRRLLLHGKPFNGQQVAHVAQLNGANGSIGNNSVTRVTGYSNSRVSGRYLYVGSYSIGVSRSAWYEVTGAIRWAYNSAGRRQLRVVDLSTGDGLAYSERAAGGISTWEGMTASSGPVYLQSGTTVEMQGWQSSGTTLNYASLLGFIGTYLRMKYIGEDLP